MLYTLYVDRRRGDADNATYGGPLHEDARQWTDGTRHQGGTLDVFRAQLEITAIDDKTMKNYKKAALIVKLLQKGPLPTVRATTRARAPCPRPLPAPPAPCILPTPPARAL